MSVSVMICNAAVLSAHNAIHLATSGKACAARMAAIPVHLSLGGHNLILGVEVFGRTRRKGARSLCMSK